jgi:DNA polymerase III delta subunit|tara:strand:- start:3571 stop:4581 length:1011 start_codon:yes stop_codon:yes gene_type:complete
MKRGWSNPPPVVVVGGTEPYLRDREIRKAVQASVSLGRDVVELNSGAEAMQTVSYASTFGMPTLVVVPASEMKAEDIIKHTAKKDTSVTLLLTVAGEINDKKIPAVAPVHGAHRISFSQPKTRKAQARAATIFAQKEADSLMKSKDVLPLRLAEALVKVVGTDLGLVYHEVLKVCTLAQARGISPLTPDLMKATLYRPGGVVLDPVREALAASNPIAMMKALDRLKAGVSDPVMLLLRAKGAPGKLATLWLQVCSLLERGASEEEISHRLNIPIWAVKTEVATAQRWGSKRLSKLVVSLSDVEGGVFIGAPSPWVACVIALVGSCTAHPPAISVGR